ncbi:YqaA family protein [Methanolobus sp. ZRKC3]|uniref:YqaA family protein n=1 Tax=Methanolobus sp. ZRKC3 TaxID=3125786 RepID=UPI003245499F
MLEQLAANIADYGYISLFITSFLASTVLPLGSEALVILLIRSDFNFMLVVSVATIGNYLGACTSYYIGLKGRIDIIEKYLSISKKNLGRADDWFKRYGSYALLFTWVPVVGDAITVFGGILKLNFKIFSVYVIIGKLARYAVIAYAAASI